MGVTGMRKPASFYFFKRKPIVQKDKCDAYLTPIAYIEKELAKNRSPVPPMWSASTHIIEAGHSLV
jgi:hypothetical protein